MTPQNILVQEEPRGPSMLIEIPVPAQVVSKVALPIIQQLNNDTTQKIIIKGLRLIPDFLLTAAPTNGGINAPLTELQKISLTLYSQGWEKGYLIPILSLNDSFCEGSGVPFRMHTTKMADWTNVDWNKSYLQYGNGTPSSGNAYNIILEVEYVRLDNNGNLIDGVN